MGEGEGDSEVQAWIGDYVGLVGVQVRGQPWCARAFWCAHRREWGVWMPLGPDWSRGNVGRGVTLHTAIEDMEGRCSVTLGERRI